MVLFQIASDLHIEVLKEIPDTSDFIVPTAEILILAGDVGRITKFDQFKTFMKNLCPKFKTVIYVLGNHEYYKVESYPEKTMGEILEMLEIVKNENPNLYVLNKSSLLIGDVCIAGCTLWSKCNVQIPPYMLKIPFMNNFKYNQMFREDYNYINRMIKYCQIKNYKLLVVTHYCPSYNLLGRGINPQNRGLDRYSCLYASNLDHLLSKEKVHTWVFGHSHQNYDYITPMGTRLVSNQRGKSRQEALNFIKTKVIEV